MKSPFNSPHPLRSIIRRINIAILRYLEVPTGTYQPFAAPHPRLLSDCLRPGDVLLIEGNSRLSAIIKYLTQSTWSHAALYVGPEKADGAETDLSAPVLLEAEAEDGVHLSPLTKYTKFNTRICRPAGLSNEARRKVVDFALSNLGKQYDSHHIIDLLRYLFPYPPVPVAFRRRMLAIGAGDPTRAICSTLIAQAFYVVNYPILPAAINETTQADADITVAPFVVREIFHIKKTELFTPRDFDVSPYFDIIKPLVESKFDYRSLTWDAD